jgi:hypothetical protein
MAKLYEISGQYADLQKIADSVEEEDADMLAAITNSLGDITESFNEKAEALMHVVRNMEAETGPIEKEIARLQDRKKAINNRQDSLRDYLRDNMERTGVKKISCPLFTITCGAGREVSIINNEALIPDDYMAVTTSIKPDKSALTKALKSGAEIPGASLERTKSSIRIK